MESTILGESDLKHNKAVFAIIIAVGMFLFVTIISVSMICSAVIPNSCVGMELDRVTAYGSPMFYFFGYGLFYVLNGGNYLGNFHRSTTTILKVDVLDSTPDPTIVDLHVSLFQ